MKTSSVIRILGGYILAVLVSYTLASLFSTASVVASLYGMDIPVSLPKFLHMSLHDLAGMAGTFLPMTAVAFAIALPVAAWLGRRQPAWRTAWFALAGATALITVHASLEAAFDIILVAGARSSLGLIAQAVAGVAGGVVSARCWALGLALRRRKVPVVQTP
jgi:hypothetical protein